MLAERCFRWLCYSSLGILFIWNFLQADFFFFPSPYVCMQHVMFQMFSKSRLQVKVNFKGVQTSGISHPSFVLLIPETDHLQLINHNKGFIEGLEKVLQPVNCSLPASFCTFWAWNTHEARAQAHLSISSLDCEGQRREEFFITACGGSRVLISVSPCPDVKYKKGHCFFYLWTRCLSRLYKSIMNLKGWTSILILITSVRSIRLGSLGPCIAQIQPVQHHCHCGASRGCALQPPASQVRPVGFSIGLLKWVWPHHPDCD